MVGRLVNCLCPECEAEMEIGPDNTVVCYRRWAHANGRQRQIALPIDLQLRAKKARMLPGLDGSTTSKNHE